MWPSRCGNGVIGNGAGGLVLAWLCVPYPFGALAGKTGEFSSPWGSKNFIDFGYSFMVSLFNRNCLKETEDRLLRIAPRFKTSPDTASR